MKVFINGEFTDEGRAFISPFSPGFMYGYGVFETIKVCRGRAVFLKEHYDRLMKGLDFLNIQADLDLQGFCDICEKLMRENVVEDGFLKIMSFKGRGGSADIIIYTGKKVYVDEYERGFGICLADSRRNEYSKLCTVKSMNYAENIIQKERAAGLGFEEAIFLNTRGDICEGCISNIFWVKEGRMYTPSINCGILPGIAREKVIELCAAEGIEIMEGGFGIEDMEGADEIFITNSLMDIMPVNRFEDRTFSICDMEFTNSLIDMYRRKYYAD
ncbi:4-amino-4-deoxychorismate lyase [Peptoclostridium litorale DSM 5388]|uniref:Putative branched-chain-amino-acid aminotransferase IlvE n=1 Tax=Peptoclostridium litorale DSM 5388 TaxID=1121324 RepID=A0A069RIH6_PEPLI|nr:aminotransferase class IV [Peptoclostridium litorale]KDR96583.1 putative branched-chain-amino-acid aminotransferase IlvE [Peptoclostridium litorale DSM 5388]SIN68836.1 4-amino-4-deoxychorismate lyase [Peptoclostridium litorale DSM 5388]